MGCRRAGSREKGRKGHLTASANVQRGLGLGKNNPNQTVEILFIASAWMCSGFWALGTAQSDHSEGRRLAS